MSGEKNIRASLSDTEKYAQTSNIGIGWSWKGTRLSKKRFHVVITH